MSKIVEQRPEQYAGKVTHVGNSKHPDQIVPADTEQVRRISKLVRGVKVE